MMLYLIRSKIIVQKIICISTNKPVGIRFGDCTIDISECEKLLRVKIDVNLSFNDHWSDLCKKASRKISALDTVNPFIGLSKTKLLMNAFSPHSWATAHSFGCAIVVVIIGKWTFFMNDA